MSLKSNIEYSQLRDQMDRVIEAVAKFHREDNSRLATHHGRFEFCLAEPCISVLRAYPDAVPAEDRPDWIEGSTHLARHA